MNCGTSGGNRPPISGSMRGRWSQRRRGSPRCRYGKRQHPGRNRRSGRKEAAKWRGRWPTISACRDPALRPRTRRRPGNGNLPGIRRQGRVVGLHGKHRRHRRRRPPPKRSPGRWRISRSARRCSPAPICSPPRSPMRPARSPSRRPSARSRPWRRRRRCTPWTCPAPRTRSRPRRRSPRNARPWRPCAPARAAGEPRCGAGRSRGTSTRGRSRPGRRRP